MWFDGGFVMTVIHSTRGVFEMWPFVIGVIRALNDVETGCCGGLFVMAPRTGSRTDEL
jgi:hypothetical protein